MAKKKISKQDDTKLPRGAKPGRSKPAQLPVATPAREATEQALLEDSDAALRSFFDSPGAMRGVVEIVAEDDVRHIADNAVTAGFLGLTPEAMQGKLGSELGEPREILRTWIGHYRQSQSIGKPVRFEYLDKREGHEAWLSATVSYLGTSPRGNPRFSYIVHDITDHKRAEKALQASEQRLLLATQAAELGIYDHDLRSDKIIWDQRLREIWGIGPDEEMTYDMVMAGLPPDDRVSVQAAVEGALDPGGTHKYHVEHRVIHRRDGTQRWVAATGDVYFDRGQPVRLIGTVQDISERKQAQEESKQLLHEVSVHAAQLREANERLAAANEDLAVTNEELRVTTEELQSEIADRRRVQEALQASRRTLETVINHMPASVALIRGSDLRLQLINPAYQAIAPAKKMTGKTLNELWPETGQDFAAICRRVLETGEPYEATDELNMIRRRPDGPLETAYFSWSLHRVRLPGDEGWGLLNTAWETTARRQAEEALRQSEDRLRLAQVAAGAGVWDWDIPSGKLEWSPELFRLLGLDPNTTNASFDSWRSVLHPEDKVNAEKQIETAVESHSPLSNEYRVVLSSGDIRWIRSLGNTAYDSSGKPQRMLGICLDVTERRQAEEVLREKEYLLSESQRIGHIGSWSVDLATETITWTGETYRLFGVSPDTFVPSADALVGLAHPDDRGAMRESMRAMSAGEQAEALEFRVVLPDGSLRVLSGQGARIDADGNRPIRIVGTVQDVTEQKRAQTALQESEERYRILLEHGFDGIFVHENLRIVQLNDRLAEMTGRARSELLDQRFIDMFTPESQERIRQYIRSEAGGHIELELPRPDGRLVAVEAFGAPCQFQGRRARIVGLRDVTERKKAEEALRESRERLERAQEIAHLGSWELDLVSNRLTWSDEVYRIFGLQPQEFGGTYEAFLDCVHPEDRAALDAGYSGSLREGRDTYEIEHRIVQRFTGEIRIVHEKCEHVRDVSGRIVRSIGMVHDITERKQAEEALRESEERFRCYFELGLIGMAITSPTKGWIEVNDECCRLLGYERDELVQKTWAELTYPDDLATDVAQFDRVLAGQIDGYTIDKRFVRKNGQVVDTTISVAALRDADGKVDYFVVLLQDITERKQAQEALHQSERRYRKLFEANLAGVYLTKLDGTILDCNDAMMRMLGYDSREELLQHRSSDFYADPEFRQELLRLLQKDGVVPAREAVLHRKDGSILYALGSAVLLVNEQTGEPYIQGASIDITERKQAEQALRELNATLESKVAQRTAELQQRARQLQKLTLQLSQAEEQERRRIATILHEDLQQQIAGAKFHLSLVRGRSKDDNLRRDVDAVDTMLKDAIEKSRSLSRDLSPAVLHMNDLAEVLQWLANRMQAQQGLNVSVSWSGDMMLHSEALATFLFRAAQEMLFNVVRHAHVREAAVRIRRIRRCVCLSVSDRGHGFDPQRLKETAGLGLFSIRERVELLGGRMRVKSAKGKGSRLSITVSDTQPVVVPPPSGVNLLQPGAAGLPSNGALRVLLVDDHDVVRQGLAALLREAPGVELVGEAPDGREAVNLANELRPDVVIMDVSMPLMSGDEATQQIKALLPQTRVIALSMYDEAEKKQKMFEAGAEGYILKTISAEELLAAIRGPSRDES